MREGRAEYEYISSRQNPSVICWASLGERREREKKRLFRFDGIKLFEEAVECGTDIVRVLVLETAKEKIIPKIESRLGQERAGAIVTVLSEGAFSKISEEKSPEGIITVAKYIDKLHKIATISNAEELARSDRRLIVLESVRDPGNVGAVIRTAAAFGTDTVVLSSDCADVYNPKTVRAAMGALFSREVLICPDLASVLRTLSASGRRVLGAALSEDAVSLTETKLTERDCIVIGNEGHGLSRNVIDSCDGCVILPMMAGPGVESLNAAVAASVFMWETARNDLMKTAGK